MKDYNEKKDMENLELENRTEDHKKDGKRTGRRALKKGVSLGLCAVLAGGLAAGSYQGVNYLRDWMGTEVQAADKKSDTLTLTKASKTESDSEDASSDTESTSSLDVSDIVEKAMPSVVSISTKTVEEVQSYYGMFGQYGYAPEEKEVEGSGSGIIIGKNDTELLVVTNYHVVEGAQTLSVAFVDNSACEAKVKGYDSNKDLAVVAVSLDDISDDTLDQISVATIGSSDDIKVGEQVVAIGNAMGYGQSVTTGIVSAKNRRVNSDYEQTTDDSTEEDSEDGINLIQTDAAINPGNSGGALLNMKGEVVGINSAKLASTTVEGIGYAIAISDVTDVIEDLMNQTTRDKVENHGYLGITGQSVGDEGTQYGIPEGVFVVDVTEGGAADEAGIKKNYVITKFDGKSVSTINELVEMLEYYEPGEEIEVTAEVLSEGGYTEKTFTVTLGEEASTDDDSEDSDSSSDDSSDSDNLFEDFVNGQEDGRSGLQFGDGVQQ